MFGGDTDTKKTNQLLFGMIGVVVAMLIILFMLLFSAMKRQTHLYKIAQHYSTQNNASTNNATGEHFRNRTFSGRKAEVASALHPSTVFEHMGRGGGNTARRLSTQFDTFASGKNIIRRAAGKEGFDNSTARQLAGGLGAENFASGRDIIHQAAGKEGFDNSTARQLAGGLGAENFIGSMPMLGGGALSDGAIAMRAADPIMSEPPSPSERQYMKENELLEHLLYK